MQSNDQSISPYPQPISGYREHQLLHGMQEEIEFLTGTTIRIWYTHLDTSYPLHWHNALEIIVGEKEHYTIEAEGRTYIVNPGDILLLPGGTQHTLQPASGCNGFVYLINLDVLYSIKSASYLLPLLSHPIYVVESEKPTLHVALTTILLQIRQDYFSTNDLRELFVYSRLLVMAEKLIHDSREESDICHNRSDKRKEYTDRFTEIVNYINHHFAEELTADGIAKRFGFSKYHFSRLFQQYTQYTFCGYVNFIRLKAAEKLMGDPDLSISDIAYQAGFCSLSSFSRVFHKYKDCTPSQYRLIYVKNNPYFAT